MFNYPISNSILIVSKDRPHEFVAVHRKEAPELVCMPGGKLDPGEDVLQAAVREAYEETGIVLSIKDLLPVYAGVCEGPKQYWATVFVAFVPGDVKLESEEPEMRPFWTTRKHFMENTSFPKFNVMALDAANQMLPISV